MQKSPNLHHLTLSHVTHQEETWSSDSDSGITVDSQSPPSKVTPDSGIGSEQPSWHLPPPSFPPPPSPLSEGAPGSTRDPGEVTAAASVVSPEEEDRQRKQDYVRNTLLHYERQKLLHEQRSSALYARNGPPDDRCSPVVYIQDTEGDPDRYRRSEDAEGDPDRYRRSDDTVTFERLSSAGRRAGTNDYVPSRMAQTADYEQSRATVRCPPDADYACLRDLERCRAALAAHLGAAGSFSTLADDGYGTDSRSTTTASLSSPLSSSLSSLTTDSSSLSGGQRGGGSARAQPVPSGGRLVVGRRALLVKRRELPPVDTPQGVTLEDRLRALTTIEEEDWAAPHGSANPRAASRDARGADSGARDPDRGARDSDTGARDSDRRARPGSGSGECPEGLYSVIRKRPDTLTGPASSPGPSPAARADRDGSRGGGDYSPAGLQRAVPVRVAPEGAACMPATGGAAGGQPGLCGHSRHACNETGSESLRSSDGDPEVRFKAGGGGVKLNKSGEFEIDYSYYLKATPSESNDEVNTYSPTRTMAEWGGAFDGRGVVESVPPRRRTASGADQPRPQTDDDGSFSPRHDLHDDLNPRLVTDSRSQGGAHGWKTRSSSRGADYDFPAESNQQSPPVGPRDSGLRQGGVMCSMPNLSLHAPAPSAHSGGRQKEQPAQLPDSDPPLPVTRRNPTPGSGYLPGGRRRGEGDRNSCDVGSLYRQSDLSQTFPPTQGLVGDRLSLTLGDLPRIHEQLRATSQLLLSSGKRHQFASSSDIYRLFQGQQRERAGVVLGRQPPHRHSFHTFTGTPSLHSLSDARPRVRANPPSSGGGRQGTDQSQTAASPTSALGLPTQGPVRGNHNISVPDSAGYSPYVSGRDKANSRHNRSMYFRDRDSVETGQSQGVYSHVTDSVGVGQNYGVYSCDTDSVERGQNQGGYSSSNAFSSGSGDAVTLRETLARGQQFSTDVIQDDSGEKLSTLV